MDGPIVLGYVLVGNAFVWSLFFWQRSRLRTKVRESVERAGKTWIIPPENAFYQGFKGFFSIKTMGAMGLTTDEIIFVPPLGRNMVFPLGNVVAIDSNAWFSGNYRGGREFVILKMADGSETGFQVKDHSRWMTEIRSRISATPS